MRKFLFKNNIGYGRNEAAQALARVFDVGRNVIIKRDIIYIYLKKNKIPKNMVYIYLHIVTYITHISPAYLTGIGA